MKQSDLDQQLLNLCDYFLLTSISGEEQYRLEYNAFNIVKLIEQGANLTSLIKSDYSPQRLKPAKLLSLYIGNSLNNIISDYLSIEELETLKKILNIFSGILPTLIKENTTQLNIALYKLLKISSCSLVGKSQDQNLLNIYVTKLKYQKIKLSLSISLLLLKKGCIINMQKDNENRENLDKKCKILIIERFFQFLNTNNTEILKEKQTLLLGKIYKKICKIIYALVKRNIITCTHYTPSQMETYVDILKNHLPIECKNYLNTMNNNLYKLLFSTTIIQKYSSLKNKLSKEHIELFSFCLKMLISINIDISSKFLIGLFLNNITPCRPLIITAKQNDILSISNNVSNNHITLLFSNEMPITISKVESFKTKKLKNKSIYKTSITLKAQKQSFINLIFSEESTIMINTDYEIEITYTQRQEVNKVTKYITQKRNFHALVSVIDNFYTLLSSDEKENLFLSLCVKQNRKFIKQLDLDISKAPLIPSKLVVFSTDALTNNIAKLA